MEVEGGTLTSLTGFDGHQGVALVVEPRRWATLDDIVARARERHEAPLVLVLDSLEDPQNVGTLLRSAEACGVHGVLFPVRRSAPIGPSAIKASAGAVEHLLMVPLDDLAGGLTDLHGRGLRIVGADESAALAFRDADLRGPLALIVGSEGRGISGHVRRRIDLAVRVPDAGQGGLAQCRGRRYPCSCSRRPLSDPAARRRSSPPCHRLTSPTVTTASADPDARCGPAWASAPRRSLEGPDEELLPGEPS